jgi:hypothetical protein
VPLRDDDFGSQLGALRTAMDAGFASVYDKIDRVDEKVVALQVSAGKNEEKVIGFTSRCSDHHIRTGKLEEWKDKTDKQITSWKGSMKVILALLGILQAVSLVVLGAALKGWRP